MLSIFVIDFSQNGNAIRASLVQYIIYSSSSTQKK